jgi:hypothetical protein
MFLETGAPVMFITSYILRRENVFLSMNLYKNNLALERPFFDSLTACSRGAVYWEKQIFIHGRWADSSWVSEYKKIFFYGVFTVLSEAKLGQLGYNRKVIRKMNKLWLKIHMWMFVKYLFIDPSFTVKLFRYFDLHLFLVMIKTTCYLALKRCKKVLGQNTWKPTLDRKSNGRATN